VWISLLRQVVEAACFTDASILLTGETGTGKELVAHLIHALSPQRNKRELVLVDCTTIVPELSGSELFGHERGAFTGAVVARDGAFALANGGTLFLDEVGELAPGLQSQLLRVAQEHTFKRVGSNTWHTTDFRLVCATNRDLLHEEAQGRFRRDLYYRIASWTFTLPPLRDRPEDILPLARHFMQELHPGQEPAELDEPVQEYLLTRNYPGNVRDLRNLALRMAYRHIGPGPITVGDIPADERPPAAPDRDSWRHGAFEQSVRQALLYGVGLREIRRVAEDTAIRIAIDEENNNLQRAARRLDVTDRALQMRRAEQRQRSAPGSDSGAPDAN
jgi:transcriptional regulator with GAF, ATPase, and Fis domain